MEDLIIKATAVLSMYLSPGETKAKEVSLGRQSPQRSQRNNSSLKKLSASVSSVREIMFWGYDNRGD